jgi:hypothetical protein
LKHTKTHKKMRRKSAMLGVILVLSQSGSAAAYACTSDAHCEYSGSEPAGWMQNVWIVWMWIVVYDV